MPRPRTEEVETMRRSIKERTREAWEALRLARADTSTHADEIDRLLTAACTLSDLCDELGIDDDESED